MKKFKDEKNVVLVMSKREYSTLCMLVASGVCHANHSNTWSKDDVNRFRAFRDDLN